MSEEKFQIDPLVALFAEAGKIHDQFIADNKRLDKAVRDGKVSEWIKTVRARSIGDYSDLEGEPDKETGAHQAG
jgi:hypothetical protein